MSELADPITAAPAVEPRPSADRQGDRPTILQVLPALETGGVERGTIDVAGAIAAEGWRSIVASAGGRMVHEIARVGAEHVVLPLAGRNPLNLRANIGRLADLIAAESVDIVHARSRGPAWSAHFAARRAGRAFVTTFHGTYNFTNGVKRRYNAIMTRGDRVIAISHFIADHIRQHYAINEERLRVIPRGIDLDAFDPARVGAGRLVQLSQRWRLPDGMPVVMLPGRLTRWKGQSVLIDALAILGRKDIRCLLVGADQGRQGFRRALEERIVGRGLAEVVHIVDNCRDMPAAYMLADVVVSASLDPEAFGRVVVEAQAMGRPTIATDHGGARETLLPGETGLLVPPGDAGALAEALATAFALGPTEREALAARSIPRIRAGFAKETMCRRTLDVYREVLGAAALPATP